MRKVFGLKIGWALVLYAFLDLVCVGMGMGVPFFCILLGFPAGWYVAQRITVQPLPAVQMLRRVLLGAVLCAAFTLVAMGLLWGAVMGPMLFDPQADLAHFGIPLILFEPRASFIGWLVLMVVISPFLQLLMVLLGAHLTLLWRLGRARL